MKFAQSTAQGIVVEIRCGPVEIAFGGLGGAATRLGRYLGDMAELSGSQTHNNLKEAFAGESQANRRYLYFAKVADAEGHGDIAEGFRATADGETGHAHGHLDYLKEVGDPVTDQPIGTTADNLRAAITAETHEYTDMYPGFAKTARAEGFDDIADWFEILAKAEKAHAGRFELMLDSL